MTSKFGGFNPIRFKPSYLTRALAVPHGGVDLKRLLRDIGDKTYQLSSIAYCRQAEHRVSSDDNWNMCRGRM